ncbi:hypothetical protein [Candidatus Stoquefichus massiliensis]|uniref:hypothetical protein n=1 Tax=Candidatus Stoquefichus massiliensis TaxID=1470350 RepID=UPI00047F7E9F|nr:hypothetical protein [Candidatus Stoquefichus massiliensis]
MRKVIIISTLIITLLVSLCPVKAKNSYFGHTQEELYDWYQSDARTFYLTGDLIVTEDYPDKYVNPDGPSFDYICFSKTDKEKVIYTNQYSLIIDYDCAWTNPNLKIVGEGADCVVKMNGYNDIHYINIEAIKGNALYISRSSGGFVFYESYQETFPSQIIAKKKAIINEAPDPKYGDNQIYTTKIVSLEDEAIISDEDVYIELSVINSYLPMTGLTNTIWVGESCVNGEWGSHAYGKWKVELPDISIGDIRETMTIQNYNVFDVSLLPSTIEINYYPVPIEWDIESFNPNKPINIIKGHILVMPEFSQLIESNVSMKIICQDPIPITDFIVADMQPRPNATYDPYFSMSEPIGFKEAYLEVSLNGIDFDRYVLTDEIISAFVNDEGMISFSLHPQFSAVPNNLDYYYRVCIIGGEREGMSNTIKVSKQEVTDEEEEKTDTPPSDENSPNDTLPDSTEGSGGHRGDQNRDDVGKDKEEIVMTPNQIEGLNKTKEDINVIIDNQQVSIPHETIETWCQANENVTIKTNENHDIVYKIDEQDEQILKSGNTKENKDDFKISDKKNLNSIYTLVLTAIVMICVIGMGLIYRRKKYEK